MANNQRARTQRMVGVAIFIAIVVALTVVATFVKFGSVPITLTLIPIVVGAAMYGPGAGAALGAAFGAMVLFFCVNGADPGGAILWTANPALTAILCLAKGMLAGFAAGHAYLAFGKKSTNRGVVVAAVVSPVVNTGIFLIGMATCFRDVMLAWANGASLVYYAFIGLAGINFLVELGLNIILSPAAVRIVKAVRR